MRDTASAEKMLTEAVELLADSTNSLTLGDSLHLLSEVQLRMGKRDKAKENVNRARDLFIENKNTPGLANCYVTIAGIEMSENAHSDAIASIDKALRIYIDLQEPLGVTNCLRLKIRCHAKLQDLNEEQFAQLASEARKAVATSHMPEVVKQVEQTIKEYENSQ